MARKLTLAQQEKNFKSFQKWMERVDEKNRSLAISDPEVLDPEINEDWEVFNFGCDPEDQVFN